MDDALTLQEQKLYFDVNLQTLKTAPRLNAEQIQAVEDHLKLLASCNTGKEWLAKLKESGNMFEIGRSDTADRYRNLQFLQTQLMAPVKAVAMGKRYAAAKAATGHADLSPLVEEANNEVTASETNANAAVDRVVSLIGYWLEWQIEPEAGRPDKLANIKLYYGQLMEFDPDFTPDKLKSFLPYRRRIIFNDTQLDEIVASLKELL